MSINCLFKLLLLHATTIQKLLSKPMYFCTPCIIIKATIFAPNKVFRFLLFYLLGVTFLKT